MVSTIVTRLILLISFSTFINADPKPDPEAGILKITQHVIHRIGKQPFKRCYSDSDCGEPHQICENNYCKCKPGFEYTKDHKCVGGLGGDCKMDSDCKIPHTVCNDEMKCECKFGYVDDGSYCYERRSLGEKCECDAQCVGDTYTCNDGTCGCAENAVLLTGLGCHLIKQINDGCLHTDQCDEGTPNAVCDNTCKCDTDFYLNDEDGACEPSSVIITLEIDSDDAWNADLATVGSPAYNALEQEWNDILNTAGVADADIGTMTFTQEGAGTKITVDITIHLPEEERRRDVGKSRWRRDVQEEDTLGDEIEEQMRKDEYRETLTELLMKREIKELEEPITISIPSMSDNTLLLDGFCLQSKDCSGNFARCFENSCTK